MNPALRIDDLVHVFHSSPHLLYNILHIYRLVFDCDGGQVQGRAQDSAGLPLLPPHLFMPWASPRPQVQRVQEFLFWPPLYVRSEARWVLVTCHTFFYLFFFTVCYPIFIIFRFFFISISFFHLLHSFLIIHWFLLLYYSLLYLLKHFILYFSHSTFIHGYSFIIFFFLVFNRFSFFSLLYIIHSLLYLLNNVNFFIFQFQLLFFPTIFSIHFFFHSYFH